MNVSKNGEGICPCGELCPLEKALSVIGGKWKIRIVCALSVDGKQRFNDLMKKINGITCAMLSASLKTLEADGIVSRRQYEEIPPRVEYSITERGRELMPILQSISRWATAEDNN